MHKETPEITKLILEAARKAHKETKDIEGPVESYRVKWPVDTKVGPGLEGAIACETKIGYVNGAKGSLIYRGYDIFDLCAYCSFEEVCYLLLYGALPTKAQLAGFKAKLVGARHIPNTLRMLVGFPVEEMHPMAALRLGANLMRQRLTWRDDMSGRPDPGLAIASDEDSIPMETVPMGERRAIYEFARRRSSRPEGVPQRTDDAASIESCIHLISGLGTLAAAIARMREDRLPKNPDPELGHAANLLYMITGEVPTPEQERVMDVALILHADHGMNASTFAALVVASTLSDIYFSVGSGIAALNGPLHGGANVQALAALEDIGLVRKVDAWYERKLRKKERIPGFGHRVYKAYDPRARILGPLAEHLVLDDPANRKLFGIARKLEKKVVGSIGKEKGIFPNVDFYSGLVYRSLGIPDDMFTAMFAVSRVAGWTARVLEYLRKNRIFRPRSWYIGEFDRPFVPMDERD